MKITVRIFVDLLELQVNNFDTVLQIKKQIKQIKKINIKHQYLFYSSTNETGRLIELKNKYTLASYGIPENASLLLIQREKDIESNKKKNKIKKNKKNINGVRRTFKLITGNTDEGRLLTKGRYKGYNPLQAASKAFSKLIKTRSDQNNIIDGEITFQIIECTRTSSKKIYNYIGERKMLEIPANRTIGWNQRCIKEKYLYLPNIQNEYKNRIRKLRLIENV